MWYVDTSVLVALCTHEDKTTDALKWYADCIGELASAAWCVTEFASAMGLKQRTGQLTPAQAQTAWLRFERICANDLELLPVLAVTFHRAALLTMDGATALRAGDALHLACALAAKARGLVTVEGVMAKYAKRLKLKSVSI